jgi:cytochrome c oxidase subunit 4
MTLDRKTEAEESKEDLRIYIGVFVALLILSIVTVAAASLQLATTLAIALALVIATVKGSLVASFFMHLIHEKKWIFFSLLLTLAFFLFLMFLPLFTYLDRVQYR